MMVSNRGSLAGLFRWQGRNVSIFLAVATATVGLHELLAHLGRPIAFELPTLPVAVIGGALGIFVSFRSNSGYDRWWEGRKLWGKLVNTSRHGASQAQSWLQPAAAETWIRRHVAYVHLLRVAMRGQDPAADPDVAAWLPDADRAVLDAPNPTYALLHRQLALVTDEADAGRLDGLRLQRLDATVDDLLDVQGGCERIKKTPVPRGYGYIAEQLVRLYAVLLPMAVVPALGWLAVPLTVVVCLSFMLIAEAGRVLEDPFTMFWNGLPLHALCRTIERDLRHRLGMDDVPAHQPDGNGILW